MNVFKEWGKTTLERAIKTFCETAVSMITVGNAFYEVQWLHILSISAVATIVSVLISLTSLDIDGKSD